MRSGVPMGLRIQALRKLWASDPGLTEGDDLSDYGDDYSSGGFVSAPRRAIAAVTVDSPCVTSVPFTSVP